ncbi:RxLR effector protein [Phytophthora megakarya]|uniref:RxLR effector protein n=1 Tax=Phytophthora megakarya TaxID=4795 RepID=A0A225VIA0_9STRA|nr:RxLR effector protein [Phytophthora megakarya]
MRLSVFLSAAVVALFAVVLPTEAQQFKLVETEGILSTGVANDVQHQRYLRAEIENDTTNGERRLQKKLPLSFVKDLLAKESLRQSTFETWYEAKLSVKRLAKSLKLKRTHLRRVDGVLNSKRKDQVELLNYYRAFRKGLE